MFKNLKSWVLNEINKVRCKQGQVDKDIYDKLMELKDGEIQDLDFMKKLTDFCISNEEKVVKLEHDVKFFRGRYEAQREQSRENLMLLMEYLGVYLDYENDKKVIKKDKKK